MKKWRFVYWLGSMQTETYVKAYSVEEAIIEFEKLKGKGIDRIIRIEEV